MAEWKVPGMAVAVIKDGKVILSEGYGLRDVENNLKVTPQTVFAIGSSSKAFTATTMGLLVDDGKVEWDKPVREYLPAFKLWDDFATERMTPRDLLCHRSGLPRHEAMWYGSPFSRVEMFDRLRYLEPSKDFRAVWQYQNLMYMTAGHLVGVLSQSSWEDFTRKRIFEPLGMTSSGFSIEDMKAAPDHSLPYAEKKDKVEEIPYKDIGTIGPAGSINSNVVDMANWVMMNLNKGKFGDKPVISEAAMTQIQSPQMVVQDPVFLLLSNFPELYYPSYGLGWFLTSYRGHTLLHHGGNIDGFSAMVSFMPRDNMGLVVLTNLNGNLLPYAVMFNIYDRLLGLDQKPWSARFKEIIDKMKAEGEKTKKEADKDRQLNTKPSHPLEDYAGEYAHPGYGTLSVTKEGDNLKARYNGKDFGLSHYHYDVFEFKDLFEGEGRGTKVTFGLDIKGNVMTATVQLEPAVKDIVFSRLPDKAMSERSFLEKFCGQYELQGQLFTVQIKGGNTLVVQVPGQPEIELVPYKGTEFTFKGMPNAAIEFVLDESGAAVEAKLKQAGAVLTAPKKK
ncbi:MAG: serine hydrolase [Candidatus Aminicenantes bacterium]|nr:serine hydrolase [Candidatus Aminicenantes bacterium]